MKRIIKSNIKEFTVDVVLTETFDIAAATYKGFTIPEGPVIDGAKGRNLSSQMIEDYESFITSVEDLCIEYYALELVYVNFSKDYSNYYTFLAKDSTGNIVLKFNLRLRISTHNPHRTKEQQKHRSEENQSTELLKFTKGKKLRPLTKSITVNSERFNSYIEAYQYIDSEIENYLKTMRG